MLKRIENYFMNKYARPFDNWAGGKSIRKQWILFKRKIIFEWRNTEGWGRFGGGWNFKFGFQLGGTTLIFNLLFCTLSIRPLK